MALLLPATPMCALPRVPATGPELAVLSTGRFRATAARDGHVAGDRAEAPGVAAWLHDEYNAAMDYLSRITVDPEKRGGKPCIRGLRITVYDVLDYLASGMTAAQIVEDVRACLAFTADRERRLMSAAS